jgi:septal ring factor EnvC (AmiA/AmiB activator)
MRVVSDRTAQLEAALADANRQLLERDDELLTLARDRELQKVREALHEAEALVRQYQAELTELNRSIAEIHRTRAWRLAVQIRSLRAAVTKLVPGRG